MSVKIGWAEVDITPEKGTKIGLAGQFFERITDEVESPVTVTAFALDSGDDQMIICSCDLVSIGVNLKNIVKEEDIDFLAQSAMDDACRPGNPKDTTKEDIIAIYKSLI